MENKFKTAIFLVVFLIQGFWLSAQQTEVDIESYGFQISELGIPKQAPDGYKSIKTVVLDKSLYPEKVYEIGFWIFGPQLPDQGYSFPIQVFPSNFMGSVDSEIFDLVNAQEIMPKLEVDPPPNYTSRGHYTFVIRPDTLYNYVTVALKVNSWERPPINLSKDVTVTGVFVRPSPEGQKDENEEIPLKIPETIAERKLIDSEKSYTVSEKEITIGLYDHRNIDKDRVTIYLNNEIIVEDFELKRKKKFFKATLKPGTNSITLHAENLGKVAPNTAAIIIKNKSQELRAVLESDLGTSQYFTLVYKPQ